MNRTKRLTALSFTALFAALTAAGTFITVPLPFSPVPIVFQNIFALLSGLVLGPLLGTAAVGLYLLVGILGLPVFAGARGGVAHILGPTGGYLLGYALGALAAGLSVGRLRGGVKTPLWRITLAVTVGMVAIYIPGILRLKMVLDREWPAVLAAGLLPFILGDLIKGALAVLITPRLRRIAADHLDG